MADASLSWPSVLAWRTERQHLAERAARRRRLGVVADLAGLHAQVMASAEASLWARVQGLHRDDVATALWQDRSLVKTWAMRGTLHLLPADELGLWAGALGVLEERQRAPGVLKRIGVSRAECDAVTEAIPEALDGVELTREELAEAVARISGKPKLRDRILGQYGDQLLKPAAFRGTLCFGRSDGPKVRFTHPASWLSGVDPVDPEDAGREVTRRWLRAYGPATKQDLGRWTGTTTGQGGAWLEALGDEAVQVDVEGSALTILAEGVEAAGAAEPVGAVRLLPAYDVLTAAVPKSAPPVIADEHRPRVWASAGRLLPVLVVDGRIVGTWRQDRDAAGFAVTVEPFADVGAAVREAAEAEAAALAAFLDAGELELTWAG